MKLSIIVPIYNEATTIKKIIKKIQNVKTETKKEIILIDDGSTDGSKEIIKKYKKTPGFKIILKEKNEGKGNAVITGLNQSTGDILLIQDADLEYNPKDYIKLIQPIINKETQVVYGTRFKSKKGHLKSNKITYALHYTGNLLLTKMTNLLYNSNLTDMETGYKVFTRKVLKDIELKSKRFEFEPEITTKILKKGYNIKEIPIDYFSRDFKEGKKITWRDGIKTAYYLIKYKLEK